MCEKMVRCCVGQCTFFFTCMFEEACKLPFLYILCFVLFFRNSLMKMKVKIDQTLCQEGIEMYREKVTPAIRFVVGYDNIVNKIPTITSVEIY